MFLCKFEVARVSNIYSKCALCFFIYFNAFFNFDLMQVLFAFNFTLNKRN